MLTLPAALILAVFGKNIFTFIYKSAGNIEITMLQIGCINIILVSFAVYMYRVLKKLDMKILLILIPTIAFVIQTLVMSFIVKLPTIGALSLIISEMIFWLLIVSMELLLSIKTLKPRVNINN